MSRSSSCELTEESVVSKIFGLVKNTCFSKEKIPVTLLSSKSFGADLDDIVGAVSTLRR